MDIKNAYCFFLEYKTVVDEIYGLYLDATRGFFSIREETIKGQNMMKNTHNLTQEYLDNCNMSYGVGHPNSPDTYILHVCTQKEFMERNDKGGRNYTTLSRLCIVQIYQYWEDYYRGKIAQELSIEKTDLKSEIFGDLRLLRHSIIHHRAVALPEINQCKIINWFKEGDLINLDEKQIETAFLLVKTEIDNLIKTFCV